MEANQRALEGASLNDFLVHGKRILVAHVPPLPTSPVTSKRDQLKHFSATIGNRKSGKKL
jgi:hypothetical protein